MINHQTPKHEVVINESNNIPNFDPKFLQIFPTINESEMYNYIRIQNGKEVFTFEFISVALNKILSKIRITDGFIQWGYSLNDSKTDLSITLEWKNNPFHRECSKTYNFKLSHN